MSFMHSDTTTVVGGGGSGLNTTITVGHQSGSAGTAHDGFFTYSIPYNYSTYGYDGGADGPFYNLPNYGAIGAATYIDGSSTSRTITSVFWSTVYVSSDNQPGDLWLTINGDPVPDTDATFKKITINGTVFNRSDRSNYYATGSSGGPGDPGATTWVWASPNPVNPFGFTVGALIPFKLDLT